MTDKIFADGISFREPAPTAPDFVKGRLAVNKKFFDFFEKHKDERGWLNMNIKVSQKGTAYVELDTWKPTKQEASKVTENADIDF